jgi:hypothetical protein
MALYDIAYMVNGHAQIEADSEDEAVVQLEASLDIDGLDLYAVITIDEVS